MNYLSNTLNSTQLHSRKDMEFTLTPPIWWSNKRGALGIDFLKILAELVDNYLQMPLVIEKK
jgi:hypothetical protein